MQVQSIFIIKHLIIKCAPWRRKSTNNSAVERALHFVLQSLLSESPREIFEMSMISSREISVLPEGFCSETSEASVSIALMAYSLLYFYHNPSLGFAKLFQLL